ncbi:formate dehydrogenase accessory sulfurtransferase FdhD [Ornithinimicrobium sp. Arc0846-15]|nr:formate dehydrogenase accessory sulfurtransferase FdhD [Ornithinimicrobium laminariae]
MGRVTARHRTVRIDVDRGVRRARPETVAVEEPLELRIGSTPLTVTMRTPGDDIELLHGFLYAEGIITGRTDIDGARYCAGSVADEGLGVEVNTYNVIEIDLAEGVPDPIAAGKQRSFGTTSSCGVCGAASIEALDVRAPFELSADRVELSAQTLLLLPDELRKQQKAFDRTGGLHAAGLFTADGEPLVVREDVGRHNAVDKVIGWAIQAERLPLSEAVLQVSGRVSFELVQKAYLAGIPVLSAVSAPSSLAVATAHHAGMTLAGFVRGSTCNVYTHPDRIT